MAVLVQRSPANRQGPDIADPLLVSDLVKIERGRNEIDAACSHREAVTATGPYREFISPGSLVEVADSEQLVWRGMVKVAAITIDRTEEGFAVDINLTIERVAP